MSTPFIDRFGDLLNGTITGFDRIVFKGTILSLAHLGGALSYLSWHRILNKEYKGWMLKQTKALVESVEEYSRSQTGEGIIHLGTWKERKEKIAHEHQLKKGINSGLIGAWSCQESGRSYRAYYDPDAGKPAMRPYRPQCKHIYLYFDHRDFGFMNMRIQTWFPFHLQICMNGREWLRRSLEKEGIEFVCKGNKFLHLGNYERAQQLLDKQKETLWDSVLNGFLPTVFPTFRQTFDESISYYWTLWQSEWATDFIFKSPDMLNSIMNRLAQHAFMSGTAGRVMRYLDRPLTKEGQPYANFSGQLTSRFSEFHEGVRVRHWINSNSIKGYNELNNFRVECTVNDPSEFKAFRHAFGESASAEKVRRPLRKGVVDTALRATVSQEVNDRFSANLAEINGETPLKDLLNDVTEVKRKNGKKVRALAPLGKDRELLMAIADPAFALTGMTNAGLRKKLVSTSWAKGYHDKQLAARITRNLSMLRGHSLIRKIPNRHAYHLTEKGRKLTQALPAVMNASTQQLMDIAA